jgi:hypothetical protein
MSRARIVFALGAWAIAVLSIPATGCKSRAHTPGLGDDTLPPSTPLGPCVDNDHDGYGQNCALGSDCDDNDPTVTRQCYACLHSGPGCPCTSEGASMTCGQVMSQSSSQTICNYGESTCHGGEWGSCVPSGKMVKSFSTAATSRRLEGLAGPSTCVENICDPYCLQFADTPDGTLTGGGIVGTSSGLTLSPSDGGLETEGPIPPNIQAILDAAGLAPRAGAAVIYHELLTPASDEVAATTASGSDIYFLDYTIGRDTGVLRDMMDFAHDGGVADRLQDLLPDMAFGAGHYEQYNEMPWNETGTATVPYEHLLSMTSSRSALAGAVTWLDGHLRDSFPYPRSWAQAIFALSTTDGLRASQGYVVPPRSAWVSPLGGDAGSCLNGGIGYPCFRPGRLPITVLFADAPSNNGPGGQHAYQRSDAAGIDGAKPWSQVSPITVTGNGSEATARAIDVTTFGIYVGNTDASGTSNQTWDWDDFDDCHEDSFRAKNVFYKFHVDDRTWFHFDTFGSHFDTVLYLYQDTGPGNDHGIACNDQALLNPTASADDSSIDGVVDPGSYYLVVDGRSGNDGDYVLHVNAMPDGAMSGPVAAPNYDEAIAAYNAIGGKVVGIDASGFACHDGPNSFVESNTSNALEKVAHDTNSLDPITAKPYLVHLDPWGPPCNSGDLPGETQVVNAIVGLATRPVDITLEAFDLDDAIDFDGPPGGANWLTPINIDDATFLSSVTAVRTPEAVAGCQQVASDRFIACKPGTPVRFQATFAKPPNLPASSQTQIFTFSLRVLGDGASVLSEHPVVLTVPATAPYAEAWFVRDYDGVDACPVGTAPTWGLWSWASTTPGDSRIDFEIAVANAASDLGSSSFMPLEFTDPPGPTDSVGEFIGAVDGTPDTQQGGTVVDTTLAHNGRPRQSPFLRMRAHLIPSSDRLLAPTLESWNLEISCRPSE